VTSVEYKFRVIEGGECGHGADVSDVADAIRERARRIFTRDGYHWPMAMVLSRVPGGLAPTIISPESSINEQGSKTAFLTAVKRLIKEHKGVAVITVTEAWKLVGQTAEEWLADANHRPMRLHPERLEILGVTLETRGGAQGWSAPILRDGAEPTLGEWQRSGSLLVGSFCELLEERPRA